MKKFLSIILALMILLSLVTFSFAEEDQPEELAAEEFSVSDALLESLNAAPAVSSPSARVEDFGGSLTDMQAFESKNSIFPYETMLGLSISLSDLDNASTLDYAINNVSNTSSLEKYAVLIFKGSSLNDIGPDNTVSAWEASVKDYPKGTLYIGLDIDWSTWEPGNYLAVSFMAKEPLLGIGDLQIDEGSIYPLSFEITEEIRPMRSLYLSDYDNGIAIESNRTLTVEPGTTKELQITVLPYKSTDSRKLSVSMGNPSMIDCAVSEYGGYITIKMGAGSKGLVCCTVTIGNISKHFFINTPGVEEGDLAADYISYPSCTEPGEVSRIYCPLCDTEMSGPAVIPALGHNFTRKSINAVYKKSDATCTEAAVYYYSCVCGEAGTATFSYGSPKGHSFSEEWSCDENYHWHAATCEHTDIQGSKAAHSWDSGIVITPADIGVEGLKTCTCTVCGAEKDFVIPALEPDPKTEFVKRQYKVFLGREAKDDELEYYLWLLNSQGYTGVQVAKEFVFSDEFTIKNYCDKHFVIALYNGFMGREPLDNEIENWVWRLQQGDRREDIFNEFAVSSEFGNICAAAEIERGEKLTIEGSGTRQGGYCTVAGCTSYEKIAAFAERLYTVCLDRSPSQKEIDDWHYSLVHGDYTATGAEQFFLFSSEFENHNYDNTQFIEHLYAAMMDREASEGDLEYWVWELSSNGMSRKTAFERFADSDEFKMICQKYGVIHG